MYYIIIIIYVTINYAGYEINIYNYINYKTIKLYKKSSDSY